MTGEENYKSEIKVQPIKKGTVIDHIEAGKALLVIKILGLPNEKHKGTISIIMNAPSGKVDKKDVIKIEDRELNNRELGKIALISENATINIIENMKVIKKYKVSLPDEITGILKCGNPSCISNIEKEGIIPISKLISRHPVKIRCKFCERLQEDIIESVEKA